MDLGIIRADGQTMYQVCDDDYTVTRETRKGKDGQYVETGIVKRMLTVKSTVKQAMDGECQVVVLPDGSSGLVRELRITERVMDAAQVAAEREAKALDRIVPEVRKRLGLSKSKQAVSDRDKLTDAMLGEWMMAKRQVMGKDWEPLPQKVKEGVIKARSEAAGKAGRVNKPASPTEVMKSLAAALESKGLLDDESKRQVEELLARQAKARAARVKEESELTEQSDI